jgi:putative SOS response-associated peptidase YedK
MWGRIVLYSDPPRYAALLGAGLDPELEGWEPLWNVGPTTPIPGATEARDGARVLRLYRWGLVPMWANDINAVINAVKVRSTPGRRARVPIRVRAQADPRAVGSTKNDGPKLLDPLELISQ